MIGFQVTVKNVGENVGDVFLRHCIVVQLGVVVISWSQSM